MRHKADISSYESPDRRIRSLFGSLFGIIIRDEEKTIFKLMLLTHQKVAKKAQEENGCFADAFFRIAVVSAHQSIAEVP